MFGIASDLGGKEVLKECQSDHITINTKFCKIFIHCERINDIVSRMGFAVVSLDSRRVSDDEYK